MSISEAIAKMDLTQLAQFETAVRKLVKIRRKSLTDPVLQGKGTIGLLQPVKPKKGSRKKTKTYVRVNAGVQEFKRGAFIVEVSEPEDFLGQKLEVSPEYLHEPFGSPGKVENLD